MPNEQERLAALEAQMSDIKQALIRIDTKLDTLATHYPNKDTVNEMFRARDEQIRDLRQEVDRLRDEKHTEQQTVKSALPNWISSIIAVIAVVVSILGAVHNGR